MATTIHPTVPVAQPEAELWPVDNDPTSIQADEMFARQLDTGFAGEIRALLYDPATGLAGKGPEDALGGIAEAMPLLGELKDRYLAQAIGPRQKANRYSERRIYACEHDDRNLCHVLQLRTATSHLAKSARHISHAYFNSLRERPRLSVGNQLSIAGRSSRLCHQIQGGQDV